MFRRLNASNVTIFSEFVYLAFEECDIFTVIVNFVTKKTLEYTLTGEKRGN
jgi:hypothetical protein